MRGFITNIERDTLENENFRKVLYTTEKSQLVVMTIAPGEDIGEEVHETHDQFIRIEEGEGEAVLDGERQRIGDDFAVVIPAGTRHNIVNTSETEPLKLYTVYTPPEHQRGTVHGTKADALENEEHFDGGTDL